MATSGLAASRLHLEITESAFVDGSEQIMDQLDVIEAEGYRADRFISIHTQEEKDFAYNVAVAERGAWIEYDHERAWTQ